MKVTKFISALLSLIMLISLLGISASAEMTGEGTAENPYVISDVTGLKAFRDAVNTGTTYENQYITLTNGTYDISDEDWTPIGNGTRSDKSYTGNAFKGTIDFSGSAISGLKITVEPSNKDMALGLFGVVDGGTVKNLVLNNVSINVPTSELAGGAIGLMVSGATADNITVSGTINAKRGNAGIVGRMIESGTISNCVNNAAITATGANVAGIVSAAYYTAADKEMTISDCVNNGEITGTDAAGGIVGFSAANVKDCKNTAGISATGYGVGGIIGEQQNYGSIIDCENTADITTTTTTPKSYGAGGIVGWIRYSGADTNYPRKALISVSGNNNSGSISGGSITGAGGIVGVVYNAGTIQNNVNTAKSISGGQYVAGIVGGIQVEQSGNAYITDGKVTVSNNISATPENALSGSLTNLYVYNNNTSFTHTAILGNSTATLGGADFAANSGVVFDGEKYYDTMLKALAGVNGIDNAVLYCKPGADVGIMTHGHLCKNLTVYGNGAYISGGEQDFEIDTSLCNGSATASALTGDVTLTVDNLTGAGAWGERKSAYTVNMKFTNCKDMGRIYFTGVTGETNITVENCTFTSNTAGQCKIYSNANGTIKVNNCSFSNVNEAINLNHKAAGTQTVEINNCSFDTVGHNVEWSAPVRVLSSVEGGITDLTVNSCTFANTVTNSVGQDADILLDYGVGTTTAKINATDAKAAVEKEKNVAEYTDVTTDKDVTITNNAKAPEVTWQTGTDAGYYFDTDTKYGMMRFLFAAEQKDEITEVGIKYSKASNITEEVNASVSKAGNINAFYGDVTSIPSDSTDTIYAAAYIKTANGTFWSAPIFCNPNWSNDYSDYTTGGAQ